MASQDSSSGETRPKRRRIAELEEDDDEDDDEQQQQIGASSSPAPSDGDGDDISPASPEERAARLSRRAAQRRRIREAREEALELAGENEDYQDVDEGKNTAITSVQSSDDSYSMLMWFE